jgi:hypothetical protein
MDKGSKIILNRPSQWMNRARAYRVIIDGEEKGQIRNGSAEEFLIAPGTHKLYCQLAWYKSPVFTVTLVGGDVEYLRVKSGMKYYWPLLIVMVLGISMNLYFSRRAEEGSLVIRTLQLILILPALLYMLYYLTIGRKYYLLMEQDKDNVFAS